MTAPRALLDHETAVNSGVPERRHLGSDRGLDAHDGGRRAGVVVQHGRAALIYQVSAHMVTVPDVPEPPISPPRKRMKAAVRRTSLLAAAREVFLQSGYAGARTKDIALHAGVTEALLYAHFASKDELFQTAVLEPLEELVEELVVLSANIDTTLDRDSLLAEGVQLHEHRARVMLQIAPLWAVMLFADGDSSRRFYRERLVPILDRYSATLGRFFERRNIELDPSVVSLAMLGMYGWIAFDAIAREKELDTAYVARQLAPLLVNLTGNAP
jgi:AcrR family transcriptional regulator